MSGTKAGSLLVMATVTEVLDVPVKSQYQSCSRPQATAWHLSPSGGGGYDPLGHNTIIEVLRWIQRSTQATLVSLIS